MYDVIDFHSHVYPDLIAKKAAKNVSEFYSIAVKNENSNVATLLESGDKANIKKFVIHSVATTPRQVRSINRFISSECAKHKDRLIGFAAAHPDLETSLEEIDKAINLGFKGLKIHPDTQAFNIDCDKMLPIYDYIQDKIPILIHCGDYRYDYSHPRRLARILKMFPKLKVIAAHFGGWSIWDLAMEYLLNENCYLDTSSSFNFLGKVRSREIIKAYGAERLLFGVDFPMGNHKAELDFFLSLNLSDKENKLILHDNAAQLLNI